MVRRDAAWEQEHVSHRATKPQRANRDFLRVFVPSCEPHSGKSAFISKDGAWYAPYKNPDGCHLQYCLDTWPYEIPTNTLVYLGRITKIEVGIAKFVHHVRTLKRVSPKIFLFVFAPRLTSIHVTAKHEFFDKFVQHRARIERRAMRFAGLECHLLAVGYIHQ
jgi:hypothetical protein